MRNATLPRLTVLAALTVALTGTPPAAADTLLHADPTAQNVTAYGGVLMWSRQDGPGKHRLVRRVGTTVSDAPVPSSGHPFDPDLGPAGKGRIAAVYERCRATFRRCDVYRLDVGSGKERRVRAVSTRAGREFGASVWGDRYAFGRETRLRDGLFTASRARTRLMSRHPVVETDLSGRTIGFATYRASEQVQVDFTGIYVHRVRARGRGRSCLVDRGDQGGEEGTALNSPVLDGQHLYWHDFTAKPGIVERVARVGLSSACTRRPRVQFSDRTLPVGVDSIAVDGGILYYTQGDLVDAVGIYAADSPPPRFTGG